MLVRRRPATLVAGLTLLLTLGACSSSGGDKAEVKTNGTSTSAAPSTTTASTTATTAPSETTTGADEPSVAEMEAQSRAAAVNLVAGDFPSGWSAEADTSTSESALEKCATTDLATHLLAKARSDNFSKTQDQGQLQISSTVGVLDTPEAAAGLLDEFRNDTFVTCAGNSLGDGAQGFSVQGSLSRNDTEPGLGDGAVALSGDYVLTPDDGSGTHQLSAIVVAIKGNDSLAIVTAVAIDTPGDEALLRDVLVKVSDRILA